MPPEGGRLEPIDGGNWRDFVAAPAAVLLIGKSTCPVCQEYARELGDALGAADAWSGVRFGKVELDRGGLVDFKRANPWLVDLDTLPFTRIYRNGELWKEFAGGGVDRLRTRLDQLDADPATA